MQILVHSFSSWSIPDSTFNFYGDSVGRSTGEIANLRAVAMQSRPQLVFLHGFNGNELIQAVKFLNAALPTTVVIPHCINLDPKFLIDLMREGIREVITDDSEDAVREALKRAKNYLNELQIKDGTTAKKIGLIAAKGGDGSSCLAANLSYAIARNFNGKVLAIDLSLPFGDLDMFLTNSTIAHNLSHFSEEIDRLDGSLIESMAFQITPNFHFISAPTTFSDALKLDWTRIQKLIKIASKHYQYLVFDLGNQINSLSIATLEAVDDLVIIASNNMLSIRRASQIMRLWDELGRKSEDVMLVINRYQNDSDLGINQISRAIGKEIAETFPDDRDGVEEALIKGKPLVEFNPKSALSKAIYKWATHWTGSPPPKEKSLWQRLKTK